MACQSRCEGRRQFCLGFRSSLVSFSASAYQFQTQKL
jgi:hypothetical protein